VVTRHPPEAAGRRTDQAVGGESGERSHATAAYERPGTPTPRRGRLRGHVVEAYRGETNRCAARMTSRVCPSWKTSIGALDRRCGLAPSIHDFTA
jgi:hypothetical protein